eukprot:scaffold627285_cov29-Prasinocladus_malaysianus.AAC.1
MSWYKYEYNACTRRSNPPRRQERSSDYIAFTAISERNLNESKHCVVCSSVPLVLVQYFGTGQRGLVRARTCDQAALKSK